MKAQYFIGIDNVIDNKKSRGALVVMKRTTNGTEIIKTITWFDKCPKLQKLRMKLYLWNFKRLYRNVRIIKETNGSID